ncbi:Dehydrogenase [Minicystis rosea]|nr:Dehydrogenase [Minicystis rosea]
MADVLVKESRIDVLVNAAGYGVMGAFEELTLENAENLFATNFFGTLRVTREVLPAMRAQRSGPIVNVSSVLGFRT